MSALPTPREVAVQLATLGRQLDDATDEIVALDEAHVRAKHAFEVAFARAFLASTGAMDVRKQVAILETQVERLEVDLAEAKLRAARERIRTLRDRLEIGRSLNAAVRAEWAGSGVEP